MSSELFKSALLGALVENKYEKIGATTYCRAVVSDVIYVHVGDKDVTLWREKPDGAYETRGFHISKPDDWVEAMQSLSELAPETFNAHA